jgi:hypothetical protein
MLYRKIDEFTSVKEQCSAAALKLMELGASKDTILSWLDEILTTYLKGVQVSCSLQCFH